LVKRKRSRLRIMVAMDRKVNNFNPLLTRQRDIDRLLRRESKERERAESKVAGRS